MSQRDEDLRCLRAVVEGGDRPGVRVTHEQRAEGPLYAVEIVLTWAAGQSHSTSARATRLETTNRHNQGDRS